jgi:hypothetical protein
VEWNHLHGRRLTRRDGQGQHPHNPVWDFLWKLKIPSKVKIFIWKSLHGIVLGNAILADRHIPISGQCPVCAQGSEDIRHLIFTCDRAREVWTALGLKEVSENSLVVDRSGSVVLEEILCRNIQTPTHSSHIGVKEPIMVATWYCYILIQIL